METRTDSGPGWDGNAITPSDTVDLTFGCRGIYVGVSGDIKVLSPRGNTVTYVGVPQGTILPVRAVRVFATDTTATSLVAIG